MSHREGWVCLNCSNDDRGRFYRRVYDDGSIDIECLACGSLHTEYGQLEYDTPDLDGSAS